MKLQKEDKTLLLSWGFKEWEFPQIEEALRADKTTYILDDKRIGRQQTMELVGRRAFLAGIARSAFHCSATLDTADGRVVYLDSGRLFK